MSAYAAEMADFYNNHSCHHKLGSFKMPPTYLISDGRPHRPTESPEVHRQHPLQERVQNINYARLAMSAYAAEMADFYKNHSKHLKPGKSRLFCLTPTYLIIGGSIFPKPIITESEEKHIKLICQACIDYLPELDHVIETKNENSKTNGEKMENETFGSIKCYEVKSLDDFEDCIKERRRNPMVIYRHLETKKTSNAIDGGQWRDEEPLKELFNWYQELTKEKETAIDKCKKYCEKNLEFYF